MPLTDKSRFIHYVSKVCATCVHAETCEHVIISRPAYCSAWELNPHEIGHDATNAVCCKSFILSSGFPAGYYVERVQNGTANDEEKWVVNNLSVVANVEHRGCVTTYFRCDLHDATTDLCTDYENRPEFCRKHGTFAQRCSFHKCNTRSKHGLCLLATDELLAKGTKLAEVVETDLDRVAISDLTDGKRCALALALLADDIVHNPGEHGVHYSEIEPKKEWLGLAAAKAEETELQAALRKAQTDAFDACAMPVAEACERAEIVPPDYDRFDDRPCFGLGKD